MTTVLIVLFSLAFTAILCLGITNIYLNKEIEKIKKEK